MKTAESATVIGRSTTFRGELVGSDEIVIEGTLEGSIQADGARVTIGKEARVRADVTAQEVIIFGQVDGNIRATERVDLRSTAVVKGDLYAKRIAMEEDAVLHGKVDPNKASEPFGSQTPVASPPVTIMEVRPAEPFTPIMMPTPLRSEGRSMPSMLAAAERSLSGADVTEEQAGELFTESQG